MGKENESITIKKKIIVAQELAMNPGNSENFLKLVNEMTEEVINAIRQKVEQNIQTGKKGLPK